MEGAFRDAKEKTLLCAHAALEKKAFDIAILELRALSPVTDYFLICSGRSDRQVQAIAESIEETMKKLGVRPLGVEGAGVGRWILMDYDDVIIHIFYEPVRAYFDLEGLWIGAPHIAPTDTMD